MANNQTKVVITAQDDTKGAIDSIKANLGTLKTAAGSISQSWAALGAVGFAGVSIADFAAKARATLDNAEAINKLSQKTGIATETLSGFRVAAQLADVSQEELGVGLKKLAVNMAGAAGGGQEQIKLFKTMGISIKDAAGNLRGTDEVFREIGDKFASYKDGPEKAALAVAAFGKSGESLIPMLNSLRETESVAKQLGAVFGGEFAAKAEQFNDNMKKMGVAAEGAKISFMMPFVEGLKEITKEMVENTATGSRWIAMLKAGAQVLGFMDTKKLHMEKEYVRIPDQLAELEANQARLKGTRAGSMPGVMEGIEEKIAKLKGRSEFLRAELGDFAGPRPGPAKELVTAPIIDKSPDNSAALLALQKRQIAALQQMEEKKKALYGLTEEEIMLQRVQTGTYKDFDDATAARLLNMAVELDTRKQFIDVMNIEENSRKSVYDTMKKAGDIQRAQNDAAFEMRDQMAFELDLIGKTVVEQERLNGLRKIDLEVRKATQSIAEAYGDDFSGYEREAALIEANAKLQKDVLTDGLAARIAAERSWSTGAAGAMDDYLSHATNAAEQSRTLFTNAFKGMEDALVSFVKTGKLDFKSLADSMITDLIRIQVQNQIMKPLVGTNESPGLLSQGISSMAGGVGSFFSNLVGGGRASGGPVSPGQYYVVGENGPEILMPRTSGLVIPNGGSAGGAASANNFTINFNVVTNDAGSFRSSLAANKNVIIGVIREAALKGARQSPI